MKNANASTSLKLTKSIFVGLWRMVQGLVALTMLYSFIAMVINKAYYLFTGQLGSMTANQVATSAPILQPGLVVTLPDPIAAIIISCIVVGVLTYIVMKQVCGSEWVMEVSHYEDCWEEISWNPLSWISSIVCTVVTTIKWVIKIIYRILPVVITVLIISCVVIAVAVVVL